MAKKEEQFFVEEQKILNRIYLIREQKVMLGFQRIFIALKKSS